MPKEGKCKITYNISAIVSLNKRVKAKIALMYHVTIIYIFYKKIIIIWNLSSYLGGKFLYICNRMLQIMFKKFRT